MKKKVLLTICILLVFVFALSFSGCYGLFPNSNNNETNENNTVTQEVIKKYYTVTYTYAVPEASETKTLADVVEEVEESVVTVTAKNKGSGSGVMIAKSETENSIYIFTCLHVVEGVSSGNISVTTFDGITRPAVAVGADIDTDIAVLRIAYFAGATVASIRAISDLGDGEDFSVLRRGESVFLIGNPLGTLEGSVASGIISATRRTITISEQNYSVIQTDAAVNPGNSGGPLFDETGLLIGIINAKTAGTTVEGIGYAIPIDDAISVLTRLLSV